MKYHLFNVRQFEARPGFISCQIAPADSVIGSDCIDVSSGNYDDILQLVALANVAAEEIIPQKKIIPIVKETIRRADISGRLNRDGRCVDFGGSSMAPICQK